MNNKRRIALREAIRLLSLASGILSAVADEEQDALDNIPENLEGSDLSDRLQENVELFESSSDTLSDIIDALSDV